MSPRAVDALTRESPRTTTVSGAPQRTAVSTGAGATEGATAGAAGADVVGAV